jgi:hypothetical protein
MMELIISEENGWNKPLKIEKAITRLGSAPTNDVQLLSQEIAPVHLQIYYLEETPFSCRVFNLGSDLPVWQGDQQLILNSFATMQIRNGSEIELGPYRIQFKLPLAATMLQESSAIQASFKFPADSVLQPNSIATGWLTIKNAGSEYDCQFEITVSGIPADCLQFDPAPLSYPGAQEDVQVQIFHRGQAPQAGFQNLTITVTSPDTYPGEKVIINQGIYVMPVFEQSLEISDDLSVISGMTKVDQDSISSGIPAHTPQMAINVIHHGATSLEDEPQLEDLQASPKPAVKNESETVVEHSLQLENSELQGANESETPQREYSKPKVVRDPSDEFWDKELR